MTSKGAVLAFFPMYVDMDNLRVLVIGGGVVASEKLQKLLDFTNNITVISTNISSETKDLIQEYALCYEERAYICGDIEGYDIVIVATDTIELHKAIYDESRSSRILVNSVDNTAYCDFIFPSYIKQGDLNISFSTSGASPAFSKQIRQYFERVIPNDVGDFLEKMKKLRRELPKGKARMQKFDGMVRNYMEKNFK